MRAWVWIRWALSLGLLAVVIYQVVTQWSRLTVTEVRAGWIVLAVALLALHIGVMIETWRLQLRFLGHPIGRRLANHILGTSNLAKYLPGGIWNLVGRAAMSGRLGVPTAIAIETIAVETTVQLGANSLVAAIALGSRGDAALPSWSPILILLPLICLQPRLINGVAGLVERVVSRSMPRIHLRYRQILLVYLIAIVNWCVLGLGFAALAQGLSGADLTIDDVILLVGAANAAWLAGSIAFFVPGALGVRELAFTVLLGAGFAAGWPAMLAVASRIWISVVEIAWFGAASLARPRPQA